MMLLSPTGSNALQGNANSDEQSRAARLGGPSPRYLGNGEPIPSREAPSSSLLRNLRGLDMA
jgi:hypothetical protein